MAQTPGGRQQDNGNDFVLPAEERRRTQKQNRRDQRNQTQHPVHEHQHRDQQIQTRERRRPIVGLGDDDNGLHATPMPN